MVNNYAMQYHSLPNLNCM